MAKETGEVVTDRETCYDSIVLWGDLSMQRNLFVVFAVVAYAIFFATFLYLVAFNGNLPWVPKTVDSGPAGNIAVAVAVDLALIAMFGVQHSVMARRSFKAAWTRIVPVPIERSVYVVFASAALILLFAAWRPIPATIWRIEHPAAVALVWVLFAAGWLIVLLSTFLLSHFELFGIKQTLLNWRRLALPDPRFRQPLFYKAVRHPLYSGFFLAFWATPVMTAGHLLLALDMSAYMLIAIRHEERDLVDLFGADYEDYRQRVGMLAPRLRRSR